MGKKNFLFCIFLFCIFLSGCGIFDKSYYCEEIFRNVTKEEAFKESSKILKKYYAEFPIKKEDLKEGVIETDWIEFLSPSAYMGKRNKIEIRLEEITNNKNSPAQNNEQQKNVLATRVKVKVLEETNKTFSESLESEKAKWKNTVSNGALQEVIMFRIHNKLNKASPGQEFLDREKILEQMLKNM